MILADMKQEEREKVLESLSQDDKEIIETFIKGLKSNERPKNESDK